MSNTHIRSRFQLKLGPMFEQDRTTRTKEREVSNFMIYSISTQFTSLMPRLQVGSGASSFRDALEQLERNVEYAGIFRKQQRYTHGTTRFPSVFTHLPQSYLNIARYAIVNVHCLTAQSSSSVEMLLLLSATTAPRSTRPECLHFFHILLKSSDQILRDFLKSFDNDFCSTLFNYVCFNYCFIIFFFSESLNAF